MSDLSIRNRYRIRKKISRGLVKRLNQTFSTEFSIDPGSIDSATVGDLKIFIVDNEILIIEFDDKVFLTIRGILRYRPTNRYVTVDMGAVQFVSKGADVMTPGIIDADQDIQKDDIVWVRDEKNLKPLAIGRSLMTGLEMIKMNSEKAVVSLHYIGDKLWKLKI